MFDMAFLQEEGGGRLSHESRLVHDHCIATGQPVTLFTRKLVLRRKLPLTSRSYVFGDMDCVHGAMKQLGIAIPEAAYYPPALAGYLHRTIWRARLGDVRHRIREGGGPLFVKPASRAKIFTGRVFAVDGDFYHAGNTSWREPVWCSTIVKWLSEYRVYVNGGNIVSVDLYDGDAAAALDLDVVTRALSDHARSGEAPIAYGIDFGILSSGETALVEANDGYSLGAYRICGADYAALTFARWQQLLETIGMQS